ncbi:PBP1A family penicillin-binding protein [Cohnella panacarvi]|uniref:PBP1A family penicillin-binding protein n=1 Tax=Cohnella panacarvi TaxID=400776 RepID=UPI000479EC69|nr:PBP1A family penicillin-binding protein [Cohnella panacarvi]
MNQSDALDSAVQRTKAKNPRNGKGRKKGKRPPGSKKRALIWLFFILLFAVVLAVVGYLLVILNGERILTANINKLNLDTASIVVDRNGKEVAKLYVSEGNREFVPIGEMPKLLTDAFVATEDKRFYEHSGIDLLGIGRALVKDVIARSAVEGASTITQQLAKNLFLNADKTLFRKGTEASIALALENHKSKDEILELYLNRIYFGKGQYGVKTAAKYYFNVSDLNKLEIWQIATLAGIPKAPNVYNPLSNPERSMERRAVVLKLMLDQGLITEKERDAAAKVEFNPKNVKEANGKYRSYLDYVIEEAKDKTGLTEEELRSSGYTIKTTIDTKAQTAMETAFANDSLFETSKDGTKAQAAMVIMDQHDGAIVAMLGGRDYQGYNRVTERRQPGSAFKPIAVYGPAIESGKFFPWSTVQDVKQCFNGYCPTNSNGKNKYRGEIPMSLAIKESRNVSAVWLLNEIGVKTGTAFANNLGIKLEPDDRNLAMALGGLTYGATPLQMAGAYAAFANGGKLQDPHSVLSITDRYGDEVYVYKAPKAERVMSETTAYYLTELMKGVVQKGGTGVNAAISGRTVAGKTGTTQNPNGPGNRDIWFVGYTPEWTAAVWTGFDKTDATHHLSTSSGEAAKMFSAVMSKALDGKKKLSFPVPDNLKEEEKLPGIDGLMAAYSETTRSVHLEWTKAEGEGLTYKIYRKEASEAGFGELGEVPDTVLDDMTIEPGKTYTYYVTAYQAAKKLESEPSEQATLDIPAGEEIVTPPPAGEGGEGGEDVPPIETPTESPEVPGNEGEDGGGIVPPVESPPPSPDGSQSPTPGDVPASATPSDNL